MKLFHVDFPFLSSSSSFLPWRTSFAKRERERRKEGMNFRARTKADHLSAILRDSSSMGKHANELSAQMRGIKIEGRCSETLPILVDYLTEMFFFVCVYFL
mmetsp:Transcript_11879/g.32945  ORF Transcript_11879/g.32945 Transcript_11879/m.32945 type:complete len:101 (+) Transcript_11879:335-637(+)